jgi:hypothetical protein
MPTRRDRADDLVEVKPAKMTLLRPAPHLCQECAVDHRPEDPHNAQSLYYGVKFKMQHERDATWADAVAHCTPAVREAWEAELRRMGAWTSHGTPIATGPLAATTIRVSPPPSEEV